jgi:hypothetical protein
MERNIRRRQGEASSECIQNGQTYKAGHQHHPRRRKQSRLRIAKHGTQVPHPLMRSGGVFSNAAVWTVASDDQLELRHLGLHQPSRLNQESNPLLGVQPTHVDTQHLTVEPELGRELEFLCVGYRCDRHAETRCVDGVLDDRDALPRVAETHHDVGATLVVGKPPGG